MTEQKLNIRINEKNGKTYHNLDFKDLDNGNYTVVEKLFASGFEGKGQYGTFYSWKVKYDGQDCSFILNEKLNAELSALGGIGDKIKVNCELKENVRKKGTYNKTFKFELIA